MARGSQAPHPDRVLELLPHRYPFLLVDRIVELGGGHAVTLKNVTRDEPFFAGHFPDRPIMPGVLILEALAQSCALLALSEVGDGSKPMFLLAGIDKARFRRRVIPGDQLRMEVRILRRRRPLWRLEAAAWVGNEMAVRTELTAMEVERE